MVLGDHTAVHATWYNRTIDHEIKYCSMISCIVNSVRSTEVRIVLDSITTVLMYLSKYIYC